MLRVQQVSSSFYKHQTESRISSLELINVLIVLNVLRTDPENWSPGSVLWNWSWTSSLNKHENLFTFQQTRVFNDRRGDRPHSSAAPQIENYSKKNKFSKTSGFHKKGQISEEKHFWEKKNNFSNKECKNKKGWKVSCSDLGGNNKSLRGLRTDSWGNI